MKKYLVKFLSLLSVFSMLLSPITAKAASNTDYSGNTDKYYVIFSKDGKMEDNLGPDMYDPLRDIQPGDTVDFEILIRNEYNGETIWYLDNQVVRSLEDYTSENKGGAYTYRLELLNSDGSPLNPAVVLFSSETVGGDESANGQTGLHEAAEGLAANGLEDFGFLTRLQSGEARKVRLTISLDGETQGNDYQNTMARTKIRFAVDVPEEEKRVRRIVKTGDEFDMLPLLAVAFFSGTLLLLLCIFRIKDSKKVKKGGA